MSTERLPADPHPDLLAEVAKVFGDVLDRDAKRIIDVFEPAEWETQADLLRRVGYIENGDYEFVAGDYDIWMTARKKRHEAEDDVIDAKQAADPKAKSDNLEFRATVAGESADNWKKIGGDEGTRIATELQRRRRKLIRRARIGRARLAVRAVTSPIRPRTRASRSARRRARAGTSSSRGDPGPGGDPDLDAPHSGGAR